MSRGDSSPFPAAPATRLALLLTVWGPGLLVMLADTDVGNIVTAAQSGTRYGYRLLAVPLLLIPLLTMVQDLAARLGLGTGRGFGELVRESCGPFWTTLAAAALASATFGSLVTEFSGVAGIGELYGVSRWLSVPGAVAGLLAIVLGGEYRRVERIAVFIGLFELAFLAVAVAAGPRLGEVAAGMARPLLGDAGYLYLAAALIGATFNPWMMFYQSSAMAEKQLGPAAHRAVWWDTAVGAVLTQVVTAAVLVAAAASLRGAAESAPLASVGQISEALTPLLGGTVGRLVFSLGVAGAALVAAIVISLAFAWGFGEIFGMRRGLAQGDGPRRRWFVAAYSACVAGGGAIVLAVPDLVQLSVATQVANAVMLPLVIGLLVWLADRRLPPGLRLGAGYARVVIGVAVVVCVAGLAGAAAAL